MLDGFLDIDFTDVSETGVMVTPGQYLVKVTDVYARVKEDTGNLVFDIDLVITSSEYKGVSVRMFQSLTDNPQSKSFMLSMLTALQALKPEDRKKSGELKVKFVYGEEDTYGRTKVKALEVNKEKRNLVGLTAIADINNRTTPAGDKVNNVRRLRKADSDTGSLGTSGGTSTVPGGLPF